MSPVRLIIALLIVLEVACGAWLVTTRLSRPLPPLPDFTDYNPHTSQLIRDDAQHIRPDVAADWADLGDVYLAHGFFSESEASFRQAVELAPEDAELIYRWALCLSSMGQLEEAKRRLHEALNASYAQPADCWYLIGQILLRQERAAEAREAFQQAGEHPAARYELAKLAVRSGQAEAARAILTRLEAEFADAHEVHLLRARAESMLRNETLETSYLDLAEVSAGRLPSPTFAFREHILAIAERFSVTQLVNRAAELLASGQADQAESLLQGAMGTYWDFEVEDLLARIDLERGDLDAQRRRLAAIVERDGANSHRLWRLGVALSAAGKNADAAAAYRAAVALNTDARVIDSLQQLSLLGERSGDLRQAKRDAARFRCAAGIQLFQEAKLAEARSALQESVMIDGQNAHAWFYLGEIARFLGDPRGARAAYDRCLELNPDHGRALAAKQIQKPR